MANPLRKTTPFSRPPPRREPGTLQLPNSREVPYHGPMSSWVARIACVSACAASVAGAAAAEIDVMGTPPNAPASRKAP